MAYEFDADAYERASAHQKEWGLRLIGELDLRGDERVLDLGCGDGRLTAELARLVAQGSVLGIDASDTMIEAARRRACANLRFEVKDIDTLDWANEFDVVFSNATLHWIKDHARLLHSVFRALRAGGAIRFNFAGDGNCSHFFKVIRRAMALPGYRAYFDDFDWPWFMPTAPEYETLLRQSDFSDFKVWEQNADRFFQDAEAMIRWIDQPSLVPFLECIAENDRQRFRAFVVERMIDETRQADGRCFETFRRINVWARKR
jgi:trans-aconitate methyltransferase